MARKCTGKPNGRPKKAIDLKTVKALSSMGLTHSEIAAVLEVSPSTLVHGEGFHELYQKGRETFTGSLRRAQFKKAMKGDTNMLKFLGANYLGQSERIRQELTGRDGGPVLHANLSKLSNGDLTHLESILAKAHPEPGAGKE